MSLVGYKSTVPVGTAAKVNQAIAKKAKVSFDVVSNPEFLREGVAVDDFMKPDRVVIGSDSSQAEAVMQQLYAPFVRQGNPIIFMDIKSAELTKYAANAFLATKITFMNEIANLCSLLGADVDAVRQGIGTDTRIGKRFLFAGTGYGGSCFPKDVQALSKSAQEVAYAFDMLKVVIKVNDQQKIKLIEPIESYLESLKGKTIAIWGLAFKPYTDDIREAPALANIDLLLEKGASLRVYDPGAMKNVRELMGDQIYFAEDQYDALEDADALMIMTEWPVFRTPDFSIVGSKMKNKVIFDGRNLYSLDQMKKLSFTYYSIGREFIEK
jgi:UDPglucose 6-dehydrogenase